MNYFWIRNSTYLLSFFFFFEIGKNYMSIVITIVSNITVLVSHNVTFFGGYMHMSHDVNKNTPPSTSLKISPLPRFNQGFLWCYKKHFIKLPLLLSD